MGIVLIFTYDVRVKIVFDMYIFLNIRRVCVVIFLFYLGFLKGGF